MINYYYYFFFLIWLQVACIISICQSWYITVIQYEQVIEAHTWIQLLYFSLHLSLTSCFDNHLMEMLTFLQLLFLASTRSSTKCFMCRWSFNPHPLNRVSCSRLSLLDSSPNLSALTRQWLFMGAPVFHFHFFSTVARQWLFS